MDQQDSMNANYGLRLPDDFIYDEEDDDEEIVIFDLPKHHPRHALIREHDTPESSYDSDTASERSTTPTCCNLISCKDKPKSKSSFMQKRHLPQHSEVKFELIPMEKEQKESAHCVISESKEKEKDIDTSQQIHHNDVLDKEEKCPSKNDKNECDSIEDNVSIHNKEETPEKDLNNYKDEGSEKNSKDISISEKNRQPRSSLDITGETSGPGDNVASSNTESKVKDIKISKTNINNDSNKNEGKHNGNVGVLSVAVPASNRKKIVYSYEEIIAALKDKLQSLLKRDNYTSVDGRADLKFVRRTTLYNPDIVLNRRIVDRVVKLGIAHVFVNVWKSVNSINFMDYDKNSCAFKNLQTALSIIWNCTDKSAQLCESLVKTHVLLDLIAELGSEKLSGSDLKHENNLYLVKAYLGILHNTVRLCSDSRRIFRSGKGVKILQWYLNSSNDLVKTKSYLILSYIINEEENDIINALDDNIQFIIDILREAMQNENHFSKTYAFWALEIVCGLNHLAVNESNKVRIGQCGAIPLYVQLLQEGNEEEQSLASAGLWILAFQEENKRLLRDDPASLEVLTKLTVSGVSENIRRAARGVMWVVQSSKESQVQEAIEDVDVPHIMVSYHHKSSQAMMIKVTRRLRHANYKVWMDLDDMHGSTLEAMALAIERSCVILVCMTQGYKDSPSCRTEAEYTYMQKKEIIPLLLQEGYSPDGWLGAFVGARLHFDFSSEDKISTEIHKLMHELGPRGKPPRQYRSSTSPGVKSMEASNIQSTSASLVSSFSMSSLHSYTTCKLTCVNSWNAEDVKAWLQLHMLSHIQNRFDCFNGELLLQMKKMMVTAPEYFYHTLETQLRFDLVTSLKFARILEDVT